MCFHSSYSDQTLGHEPRSSVRVPYKTFFSLDREFPQSRQGPSQICRVISLSYTAIQLFHHPILFVHLSARRRVIHHLCLLLRESLSDSLSALHIFLDTSRDAAGFFLYKGFGGEIVDAGIEAVGDEIRKHL